MPSFNFKGTVKDLSEKQTFGNTVVVTATIESNEDWPQKLAVDFVNKMAPVAENMKVGDVHTFSLNVNGRESKQGKNFTTLNCWKVDKGAESQEAPKKEEKSSVPF